jgi:hypothetical protein
MDLKKLVGFLVISAGLFFSSLAEAQTVNPQMNQMNKDIEVSDAELQKFLDVSRELQMLQYQMQNKMVQLIKDSPMTLERFKEISSKQQQQQKADLTSDERKTMNMLQQKMMKEQEAMKGQMDSILKKHEMEQRRFMTISRSVQSDKELQQRLKDLQQNQNNQ